MKLPQVMGMVFCEQFDIASYSLRRVFQGRHFATFPARADPFLIYAALYSRGVEGVVQCTCVRMEDEHEVFSFRTWRAFPPGTVVQLFIPVRRIRFASPGRYVFRLFFDGTELTHRYLEVIREERRK